MKRFLILFLGLAALLAPHVEAAVTAQSMECNKPFVKIVHVCGTTVGKGKVNGKDFSNCLPFADQDLWNIPAGTLISKVYPKVDVAITGTTVLEVGDDDDADGFIVDMAGGFASLTAQLWDAKAAGVYLRIQTAGATDAADVYVVPTAKYYSVATKEVKMNITTDNTAGKMRVFIEGYKYCDAY